MKIVKFKLFYLGAQHWTGGITPFSTSQKTETLLKSQNKRLAGSGLEFRLVI